MTELRKCSRCTSTVEIKYLSVNRKGEYFKTCDTCRKKRNAKQQEPHRREYNKLYYEEHKGHKNEMGKQWQYDNQGYTSEPIPCPLCGSVLRRDRMWKHIRTQSCKELRQETHNDETVNEIMNFDESCQEWHQSIGV